METLSIQVLQTAGRWFAILILLTQPALAHAQAPYDSTSEENIWNNALFLFSICFFVAGFIFMFMVKVREEKKHRRHTRRLSPRHH